MAQFIDIACYTFSVTDSIKLIGIALFVLLLGYLYRGEYLVAPSSTVGLPEISRSASDVPPPIARTENVRVVYDLETAEVVAELAPGVSYEYWTFNRTVPGPMMRVMEGDTVEIRLSHKHGSAGHSHALMDGIGDSLSLVLTPVAHADAGHAHAPASPATPTAPTPPSVDGHSAGGMTMAGHATHSIDLHAVIGPGGGAMLSQVAPDQTVSFEFKALRPGLYVYHCASPHIPTHIANGMYGLILVEPRGGLPPVDKEFYVMQGEFYTKGALGEKGLQAFDLAKLMAESPEYYVFNGRVGALTGSNALTAQAGDTIRLFFGVGSHIASNFHVIGGVLDHLYSEGAITSPPQNNVQTTIVPPGGAMMAELTIDVPGKYLLVDHSLTRAVDRGALGELVIEGAERPDIIKKLQ